MVDGVLAWRQGSWEHALHPTDRPDPADAQGANTGRASLSNVFGAPMLGVTSSWDRLAFGAALYVPFGGRSAWTDNARFLESRPVSAGRRRGPALAQHPGGAHLHLRDRRAWPTGWGRWRWG